MKKILMILVLSFMLCGCGKDSNDDKSIEEIMAENEYIIVDVRTESEYENSHLVGAINIPHDTLSESTLLDKDKVIFVYCMSGNRSSIAYNTLTNLGYEVYDLGAYDQIDLPKE